MGDPAPNFCLAADDGGVVELRQLLGARVVLMFYPAAFSPGCTLQACQLRNEFAEVQAMGATVLGVSSDDSATQARFRTQHSLPYRQLADPDFAVHRRYRIGRFSHLFAMLSGGKSRSTFIIDPAGHIEAAWYGVSSVGHANKLVTFLRARQPGL